jgi:enoyl-CoA hydratase/carnithine racemase
MSDSPLLCGIADGVATVTLNNPPFNLVTLRLTAELDALLDRLAADDGVRVLVLTGSGERAFCAGSDISEFPDLTEPGVVVERKLVQENATYAKLDHFPKPTIAAISGLAFGGGLELAVCCDLLVVEADARLCLPEIKLGVIPGAGGTFRVTRRVGEGRAKEMMFMGEPIDAATALAWGLVNRVVGKGEAVATAQAMAGQLAERPGVALRACKEAIDLSFETTEEAAIERSLELSGEVFMTDDCKEGFRAFFAKEKPRFTHR